MRLVTKIIPISPVATLWVTIAIITLLWCMTFAFMFSREIRIEHNRFYGMMTLKAEMLYQNTQAVRDWVGGHGGVYVTVGEGIYPNPLLANVPERDIVTPSGNRLTLFNSPALLRHISHDFESSTGTQIRLVSRLPVNRANALRPWETSGYAALESGKPSFSELTSRAGRQHFRIMRPMVLQKACLSCHPGYKLGDVGKLVGAVSIDLDVTADEKAHNKYSSFLFLSHIFFWGLGMAGIGAGAWKWRRLLDGLQRMATHDSLTGLHNRRMLMERLDEAFANAGRYHQDLSVIMMDVDHFKGVNDIHGHQAGDDVLRSLGELLRSEMRGTDIVARYGGEEILMVCPNTDLSKATEIAERIRARIEGTPMATMAGELRVTVSMGIADARHADSVAKLIEVADSAMYKAKEAGRNRVCSAG